MLNTPISDFVRVVDQCEKRAKKRSGYRRRIAGIFTVDKVKVDIMELKAQVASAQMRFLVCSANFSVLPVLKFDARCEARPPC